MAIAVLVVDDHLILAESLAEALAAQDDLYVVGTSSSGSRAVSVTSARRVDVAIVDTDLGGEDGVEVGRRLRVLSPSTKIIYLLEPKGPVPRVTAVLQGDVGNWVRKDESMPVLLAAVRGQQNGEARLSPLLPLLGASPVDRPGPLSVLTSRQREVLLALVDGLSRAAIGQRLYISENTVRSHIGRLFGRLGAHSRLEAVAIARAAGVQPRRPW